MPEAPRLLIVDDEAPQLLALCETLADRGYATVGAENGEAALAELRRARFDLLLTDLMLPDCDGIAVLRGALALDPELVGVLMTGQGTIATAVEAMKEGALDYVLKPFKLAELLPVLSRALEVRRLRQENAALQRGLREHALALEIANENLDSFARSVAHDLNGPARHIAAFARLTIESHGQRVDPEVLRHLEIIASEGERMGSLISDLLRFSRLARSELRCQAVDLAALANEVWGELAAQRALLEPESRERRFVWKVAALPTVQADRSLLRQVFVNLLGNAVKYTRGRAPAEIEVGDGGRSEGLSVFFVRDNGAGFDMQGVNRLFGVFQRMHAEKEFEGNGIGLATVRQIVQRHGGKVWAEGEVGRGATFHVGLPVERVR